MKTVFKESQKYVSSNNEEKIVEMIPARTKENEYKLGLWVRDAAAGVGTLTFYEPTTGSFASLGHGITDIDTGDLITIANGELVTSNIVSIKKGEKCSPGEIRGSIEGGNKIGNISKNTSFGIYGAVQGHTQADRLLFPSDQCFCHPHASQSGYGGCHAG